MVAGSSVQGMISKVRGAWPCDKAQCILVQVQPDGLEQERGLGQYCRSLTLNAVDILMPAYHSS